MLPPACDNREKKSVHFETLGCRLNQLESEGAADFFSKNGCEVSMRPSAAKDEADESVCLCVLNTCAVTGKAEQKARRVINLLLKKFPAAALVVTGCYAQLSGQLIETLDPRVVCLAGKAKSALSGVPALLDDLKNASAAELAFCLKDFFKEKNAAPQKTALEPFALSPRGFLAHSRASLKIQDGCDNACSYCAIRLARGKSVSIDAREALLRAVELEKAGQSELVLTGVNIGQYRGVWKGEAIDVSGLVSLILRNTKRIAIRFSSVYPETVTKSFCAVIKDRRVRPHFHISAQSGSDAILKKMNRAYSRQTVIQACRRLKEAKGNPFLACDIIAGFPGESDDDFAQTLSLLKEAGFSNAHAFPYSPRPGTLAADLKPKIPERVKDERVAALNEFSAEAKIAYVNSFAGVVLDAVAETVRGRSIVPHGKKLVRAVTENFIHAEIFLDEGLSAPQGGQPVRVKILCANEAAIRAGQEWEARAELCRS